MEFIKLFEPIVLNGKLEVKNRIVLPALGLVYPRPSIAPGRTAALDS
jgi:2,4-dienoyl-CoA reductase-like NADH-dependent reductase (Old Yellow Enzyme family)